MLELFHTNVASHLHICKKSACRWRKFKDVLDSVGIDWMCQPAKSADVGGSAQLTFHGPTVWNSLPSALSDSSLSLNMFKRRLKTHLFGQS